VSRSIAIICGLKSEAVVIGETLAALNAGERASVYVSGANAQTAEELASVAIAEDGAVAVLSIGISGALASDLAPGDLLIGETIVTANGERFPCDAALISQLARSSQIPAHPGESRDPESRATHSVSGFGETQGLGPGFRRDERWAGALRLRRAVLLGSDVIVASAAEKERLLLSSGAIAVDMESHGAARAATRAGVPFLAIRAIADPAHRALPKAALGAVAPDGSTRVLSTLIQCAKAPGDFPALLQLGSDSNKALKTLRRDLGGLLGALFLRFDL